MATEIRERVDGRRRLFDLHVDGVAVSHAVVHDLVLWVQGEPIRTGGLGGVSTLPEHRGRGHARALLAKVIDAMRRDGYDLSLLFGIPDYYERLGYAPFMAMWTVSVAAADARRAVGGRVPPVARLVTAEDHPFIVETHNRLARLRCASMAREAALFAGFRWGTYNLGRAEGWVVLDAGGERVAYTALRDEADRVAVIEVGCRDADAAPDLVSFLLGKARERGVDTLTLEIPGDHPFARYLVGLGCVVEARHARSGGGMIRIVRQDELLQRLRPALEKRPGPAAARLRIVTELASTSLELGGPAAGPHVEVRTTAPRLAQILTGYRTAADVLGNGQGAAILDALPALSAPFVEQADRF